jgi:hypothetical protein
VLFELGGKGEQSKGQPGEPVGLRLNEFDREVDDGLDRSASFEYNDLPGVIWRGTRCNLGRSGQRIFTGGAGVVEKGSHARSF